MGSYLSIPHTVRKVLYVEPSVTEVKTEQTGPEVKNGEWVVSDNENKVENMIDFPVLHQSDTLSDPSVHEALSPKSLDKETNEQLQKEIEQIQQQIDKLTTKQEETVPIRPPPIVIPEEEQRIPEFRNQADSSSHAIKKFNRRHRKQ
jgi:hypothetical protein